MEVDISQLAGTRIKVRKKPTVKQLWDAIDKLNRDSTVDINTMEIDGTHPGCLTLLDRSGNCVIVDLVNGKIGPLYLDGLSGLSTEDKLLYLEGYEVDKQTKALRKIVL